MRNAALLASLLAMCSAEGRLLSRRSRRRPDPTTGSGALQVKCPRCGAEPGEDCNQATLGRHFYHMARVDAFREQR